MGWRAAAAGLALLLAGCGSTVAGHGQRAAVCAPVFFGVAGSGQGPQNPPPTELPAGVTQHDADGYGTTVALLKTDLVHLAGSQLAKAAAIDYPAVPVNRYVGPDGLIGDLDTSEAEGVKALITAIRASYRGGCAARPVLLSGYSQGAEVVIRAVDRLSGREQADVAVALFGNPSYEPDLPGDYPGGTEAAGIRPSFKNFAYQLPADVRRRTIDICAPGDPVCGVDPSRTTLFGKVEYVLAHAKIHAEAYAFGTNGYAETAARFLWQHRPP